jgi:hypothetical protein
LEERASRSLRDGRRLLQNARILLQKPWRAGIVAG